MSIDDEIDEDEDVRSEAASLPFTANKEVLETYGVSYNITLNSEKFPVVSVPTA